MNARHQSLELKSVSIGRNDPAPPPPSGASMRDWFAGLALGNPELMKNVSPAMRIKEAIRLADEMTAALRVQRTPTIVSMAPPSPAEMTAWEETLERKGRDTVPAISGQRLADHAQVTFHPATLPPPAPRFAGEPDTGRYCIVEPKGE